MVARLVQSDVFYEAGVIVELAWPSFADPQARLVFSANPPYEGVIERRSLPQSIVLTPTRRSTASSIASTAVHTLELAWDYMKRGWPQAQRISDTAKLHSEEAAAEASTDYLFSLGFLSFDGVAPDRLDLEELNGVGSVVATHSLDPGTDNQYPQWPLKRLTVEFTSDASTASFRVVAESTGQDFLVTDVHAVADDGVDIFDSVDRLTDSNGDGLGDFWQLVSGGAGDSLSHYGEDAAGVEEFVEHISEGALNSFQIRKPGSGNVWNAKLIDPISDIGWTPLGPQLVSGVRFTVEKLIA